MNESPFIDPKDCSACGKCCKSFTIWYSKKDDPLVVSEAQRFKLLSANIEVKEIGDWISVEFKYPCRHLLETSDNKFFCTIYDSKIRPELCAKYPFEFSNDCPHKKKEEVR
jgi:Fe-S-cluster containining protein